MLSVLIPVFNHNIVALVNTINTQLQDAQIDYEILCLDDCSPDKSIVRANQQLNTLRKVLFCVSPTNVGRNNSRRTLAQRASYDWLLFIDADVLPKSKHFITNYLPFLKADYDAVYGGFAYYDTPTKPKDTLRWKYGKTKEQVAATKRNQTPYKIIISANCLIKKSVFLDINSKITEEGYGYDNYFGALLKTKAYKVFHIDNEVFHLGLESNAIYLNKVEQSVDNLLTLYQNQKITISDNELLNLFLKVKSLGLNYGFAFIYKCFKNPIKNNLLSNKPSILLLQFYKLSYICYKDLN